MEDVEGEAPLNLSSTSKGNEELADVDGFLTYDNSEEDNSKANPSQNGTPVREVPEEQNNKKRKADLFDLDSPTHDNISETQISKKSRDEKSSDNNGDSSPRPNLDIDSNQNSQDSFANEGHDNSRESDSRDDRPNETERENKEEEDQSNEKERGRKQERKQQGSRSGSEERNRSRSPERRFSEETGRESDRDSDRESTPVRDVAPKEEASPEKATPEPRRREPMADYTKMEFTERKPKSSPFSASLISRNLPEAPSPLYFGSAPEDNYQPGWTDDAEVERPRYRTYVTQRPPNPPRFESRSGSNFSSNNGNNDFRGGGDFSDFNRDRGDFRRNNSQNYSQLPAVVPTRPGTPPPKGGHLLPGVKISADIVPALHRKIDINDVEEEKPLKVHAERPVVPVGKVPTDLSIIEKRRVEFKKEISKVIIKTLSKKLREGKIATEDDFKHLARKMTHKIMTKEEGKFIFTPKTPAKINKFLDKFFQEKPLPYKRSQKTSSHWQPPKELTSRK
eukprot:TRINITY_DN6722_c0_g1_i2.p1 TRINITY_DN6722_c0_g1~~TRINITY_DN6722_c0_g1_i2.p1  ORF type:complete len:508 (+),score=104.16 TRINITY_DN6722_c0_g1_i2:126-1649(+)